MPKFTIHHTTRYTYDSPVRDSTNQLMLYPVKDMYQQVLRHDLDITGDPQVEIYEDYYGNEVGSFMHPGPHTELLIDSRVEVITEPRPLPEIDKSIEEQWAYLQQVKWQVPYIDFLKVEQFEGNEEVSAKVKELQTQQLKPLDAILELNKYVYDNFKYIQGVTNVETTLDEIWKLKAGVCQDFAHMLSAMLRMIGVPARYVSGYVCPDKTGMRGEGATHAWVEALIPFYGWLGFDPTNNCLATNLHVRLAVGRNFRDCSPVRGTFKGVSNQNLEVGVTVAHEDGYTNPEIVNILTPQPVKKIEKNSYQQFIEMQQQQQQQ
ncbi:MAG: transglutaminase family protein [Williamsia sp.]|nr:transglutaminase family protein [Williamsia sp.]